MNEVAEKAAQASQDTTSEATKSGGEEARKQKAVCRDQAAGYERLKHGPIVYYRIAGRVCPAIVTKPPEGKDDRVDLVFFDNIAAGRPQWVQKARKGTFDGEWWDEPGMLEVQLAHDAAIQYDST